jgi:hypothetical protein
MKQYIEIDYPTSDVLTTSQKLKPFKYGCEQRTKILRNFLRRRARKYPHARKQIYSCHAVTDYIVEKVIKDKKGNEICWIVGS